MMLPIEQRTWLKITRGIRHVAECSSELLATLPLDPDGDNCDWSDVARLIAEMQARLQWMADYTSNLRTELNDEGVNS